MSQADYSVSKFAVRAICEGLRQEAGDQLRVTVIPPGFFRTERVESVPNPQLRQQ